MCMISYTYTYGSTERERHIFAPVRFIDTLMIQ